MEPRRTQAGFDTIGRTPAPGIGICSCHTITAGADKYLPHFETGSSGELFFEGVGNSNLDLRKPKSDSTVWRAIILIRQRQRRG